MKKGILYKGTWAMPASALHTAIKEGDDKKATATFEAIMEMHRKFVTKEDDIKLSVIKKELRAEHLEMNTTFVPEYSGRMVYCKKD